MKQLLFVLGLTLLLSSCTVSFVPETATDVIIAPAPNNTNLMNLPKYPGSVVSKQKQEAKKAELEFRTSASIDSIFSFYGDHLSRQGWLRTKFSIKNKGSEYEAEYVRTGQSVKLKVEWKKDHYKVELKT